MKKFVLRLLIFSFPVVVILLLIIYVDIFRVFFKYDDYYKGTFVALNREMITTNTYNKNRESIKFNSFIFGSSRSQAYKCGKWIAYLDSAAVPFHFDASGEGIYGVANKIKYLDKLGDTIKNAVIVLDRDFLQVTANRKGHLSISPPSLSGESVVDYYTTFLQASTNTKHLVAIIDYKLSKTYRPYMKLLITRSKFPNVQNNTNCDLDYGYDADIAQDSLGYFDRLIKLGVFNERHVEKYPACKVTPREVEQVKLIGEIFARHHTNYKVIVSPHFDQIPLEHAQLQLLWSAFGKSNVYDFSGVNEFTNSISNYYESSHYRPHVANRIFDIAYGRAK